MEKMMIGRPQDTPLKNREEIFEDIERLACTSINPSEDLEYIIQNSYRLWDMHNQNRETEIKKIALKVKIEEGVLV